MNKLDNKFHFFEINVDLGNFASIYSTYGHPVTNTLDLCSPIDNNLFLDKLVATQCVSLSLVIECLNTSSCVPLISPPCTLQMGIDNNLQKQLQ